MDNRLMVIRKVLWDMNIPPTYLGAHYLAYAELLVLEDQNRLTMVTKWLYPEIASHYKTSWKSVERNIRTVITTCWNQDRGGQMARTLGTLIGSGVSMVEATEIVSGIMKNVYFKEALKDASEQVSIGMPLSRPLEECGLFPPMVYHMFRIGEESGSTEEMLDKLADYYDEEHTTISLKDKKISIKPKDLSSMDRSFYVKNLSTFYFRNIISLL